MGFLASALLVVSWQQNPALPTEIYCTVRVPHELRVGNMMQGQILPCFNYHLVFFLKSAMCKMGSLSQAFWSFSMCFTGVIDHACLKYFRHLKVSKMKAAITFKCTMFAFEIQS